MMTRAAMVIAVIFSCAAVLADVKTLEVTVLGPGGHSNGNYGNTNAVHACAHAVMNIEKNVPTALLSNLKGGVSVNAIAPDCHFTVMLQGDPDDIKKQMAAVEEAVEKGCSQENAFRGIKEGDLTRGVPAQIRCRTEVK